MRDDRQHDDREGLYERLQRARAARTQPAQPHRPARGAGRGAHPDPRPHRGRGRDLHAGRRARRQHRQLRGRPPRREQRRRRGGARRRRGRRALPRPRWSPTHRRTTRRSTDMLRHALGGRSSSTCRARRASPTGPSSCAALADGEPLLTNVPDGDDTAAMRRLPRRSSASRWCSTAIVPSSRRRRAAPPRPRCPHRRPPRRHDVAVRHRPRRRRRRAGDDRRRRRRCGARPMARAARRAGDARRPNRRSTEQAGQLPVTVTGPLARRHGGPRRRRVEPVHHRADARSARCSTAELRIELTTPLVSAPVRRPHRLGDGRLRCRGRGVGAHDRRGAGALPRLGSSPIEPDASSASYPMAVAALRAVPVTVRRAAPAARPRATAPSSSCWRRWAAPSPPTSGAPPSTRDASSPLVGIDVDMADVSDLVPTLAVVAAAATTPTTITRGRLHPGQGERPPRRPRRRADQDRRRHRRDRRRPAHRAGPGRRPARCPPRHPPRPSSGHGVRRARHGGARDRGRRPRRSCRRAGPGSGASGSSCGRSPPLSGGSTRGSAGGVSRKVVSRRGTRGARGCSRRRDVARA